MAINTAHWEFRSDKTIRYIGGAHGTATASYASVLEMHRLAQDLGDNENATNDDFMDITTVNPTDKKFDTIITLQNGWTLDDAHTTPASEYLYGGSIIQGTGGTEVIYDGIKVVAPLGVLVDIIQDDAMLANRFWNSVPDTSKTAATATVTGVNSTAQKVLNVSDSSEFPAGTKIMIGSVVDEEYLVDSVTDGTTIVLTEDLGTATSGGETLYTSVRGLNPDAANGVAMQFMVKVRDAGADIDSRSLIFTTREWFSTYSEFRIPATGRGENTVPLQYASDLNNQTALATVNGWSANFSNTEGYGTIDLNEGSGVLGYYSAWDYDTGARSINDFYEYQKALTMSGVVSTLYGETGETFRGVTHAIKFTGVATPGAFADADILYWDTDASQATVLAMDTTNHIAYVQLLKGVVPGDSETIYDAASQSGNSSTTLASNGVVEQTVSTPYCGASTGSSIVGSFGFGIVYVDLTTNDKLISLDDGVTRNPPNNVPFSVNFPTGTGSGKRLLVGPEDGAGGLDYDQLSITGPVNGAAVASISFTENRPANTPDAGTVRLANSDGKITRHEYDNISSNSPLTLDFTVAQDFSGVGDDLVNGANAFISYIDRTATGDTETFNTVQTAQQTLYIETRFGGTGPDYTDSIKPTSTTGTLNTNGGSATLSPISDA